MDLLRAILYGIIEGITEWLPVSSTGHMILAEQVLKFEQDKAFMEMFRVVIQLGAIGAVLVLFWNKLWPFGRDRKTGRVGLARRPFMLWLHILVASIPAAVLGLLLDDWMDTHLYNHIVVALMLILYGIAFLRIENNRPAVRVERVWDIDYRQALIIGCFQVLALVPGTSRSGATIVGGMLLGISRAAVAEFTFYLAIPVMAGASLLKVVKFIASGAAVGGLGLAVLLVGCVVAFLVSLLAIRFLMNYVKKNSFKVFGWYRIVLGAVVLLVGLLGLLAK